MGTDSQMDNRMTAEGRIRVWRDSAKRKKREKAHRYQQQGVIVAGRWVGRSGRGFRRDKWWWKRIIKLKLNKNSSSQGIFCSNVQSLVPVPDTELPRAKEFPDRKV